MMEVSLKKKGADKECLRIKAIMRRPIANVFVGPDSSHDSEVNKPKVGNTVSKRRHTEPRFRSS